MDHLSSLTCMNELLTSVSEEERHFLDRWRTTPLRQTPFNHPELPGYLIEQELGRGGLGKVYLAWDLAMHRQVAIKQLHIEPDSEERHRLREEAQLASSLKHPGIVQVYSMIESPDRLLLVMEYVEGGTLADLLHERLLEPDEAARLISELADALGYAHQQGVIHRDIKPSNILMTRDGRTKLADFGMAKRLEQNQTLSGTGAIVGTPAYMAPEQAAGRSKDIGPASDIHALGCVLYECLTGTSPFRAAQPLETILQVMLQEATPLRKLQSRIPIDLETICLHCLHKQPRERYTSAQALSDDLGRYLKRESISVRALNVWQQGWRWMKRKPYHAAAGLLAFSLLAVTLGFLWKLTKAQDDLAHSQALSQLQEYYRLEATIRHRSRQRPVNWVNDNLSDIASIMKMQGVTPNRVLLRTELMRALSSSSFTRVRQLSSDLGKIAAAAYAPDGKRFVLAQGTATDRTDCTVEIRSADTLLRERLLTFRAEAARDLGNGKELWDGVRSVAYSPDGRWLFGATRGGRLVRWNTVYLNATPEILRANYEGISALRATGDGKLFGLSHPFAKVSMLFVWDMATFQEMKRITLPQYCVQLLIDDQASTAYCYHAAHIYQVNLESGAVNTIHPSAIPQNTPLGRALLKLYRFSIEHAALTKQYRMQSSLPAPWHDAHSLDQSVQLVHKTETAGVHLLEMHNANLIGSYQANSEIVDLAIAPDQRQLIVLTNDQPDVVDLAASPLHWIVGSDAFPIREAKMDDRGTILLLGGTLQPRVLRPFKEGWRLWNTLPYLKMTDVPRRSMTWIAMEGKQLVTISNDILVIRDIDKNSILHEIPVGKVHAVQTMTPNQLVVSQEKLVRVFDLSLKKWRNWEPSAHPTATRNANVMTMAATADRLALGDHEGNISMYLLKEEPALERHFATLNDWIQHIEFSHQGTTLTVATRSGRLHILDVTNGQVLASEALHGDAINHVVWISPKLLVTASNDRSLQWHNWDGVRLTLLFSIELQAPVKSVYYYRSGEQLLAYIENETALQVWDVSTLMRQLNEHHLSIDNE
jgi:serine/threonine protein kinase/WD40 repeat protein